MYVNLTSKDIDAMDFDFIRWKWTGSKLQLRNSIRVSIPDTWWICGPDGWRGML